MNSEELFNHLYNLYREQSLAHAYLLETNSVDNCYSDIKNLVKRLSCPHDFSETCDKCNLCHLIDVDNLPSLITIKPEGKNIKKEAIETLKTSFSNIPLYTTNNIYIMLYPESMNATAYNKMLKFLEEPENNVIAFFITENKDKIANTIVSRCEIIKVLYNGLNKDDNIETYSDIAQNFLKHLAIGTKEAIWYNNNVLKEQLTERTDLISFFKVMLNLEEKNGNYRIVKLISKYLNQLEYNVNCPLLVNSFIVEMGYMNEK